jgi:Arc/MetJ-type ribon-helix-helix transcriptional regulator
MSIQLTPEQEQRIRTVVNAGAYHSAEEALDAAVAAVEVAGSRF